MRSAHATHLGYPYNLAGYSPVPASLGDYSSTTSAIPTPAPTTARICDLEREAVAWLMRLWECDDREDYWGSVVASGTEGNIWALYLAREALPEAMLIHSPEAHYSIPKAARILRMEQSPCPARQGRHRPRCLRQALVGSTEAGDPCLDLRHHGEGRP